MSFGFGFALPAYPLRGGGGNNPFNQLGPTLDLSFVDGATNVGDLSNPNGYTLNTNFITPQYQVAAQYVVWETGVGLVDKTFSQIVTFSRTSGATWFNSAGVNVGIDFSTSSVAIGTGSKTFTLDATAGVDRSWTAGDIVRISEQATPANFMDGTVTSYTASTQTLVVNVTATGGSGTIASWRVSNWMPRFDYNPSTLAAQGLLIEEARTNSIRNNTMQGAVAGTPGTVPTNWTNNITAGLTQEIVGTGTENGITYIDWRLSGTATGTSQIAFESTTQITAAASQAWTATSYARLVAGSLTNVSSLQMCIREGTAAGGFVRDETANFTPTSAALRTQRASVAIASTNALTERVMPRIFANTVGAVDFTLRIGLPQLEQGAFATSVIPTTTTALTRSADVASVNTLSPWYNQTEGTVYAELQSLSPLNGAQSVALGKYPHVWQIEAGASDSSLWCYGVVSELYISTTFNNIGAVPSGINKIAVSLAPTAGQSRSSLNGAAAVNRNGTLTGTATLFSLGKDSTNNVNNFLNGYLRRLTYYPRALSAAELQAITT